MNLLPQLVFFETQSGFRKWLKKNHNKTSELFVGFYKTGSGLKCMSWSQSVDEAICFGWIDGIRKSIDKTSYYIRFTPRKSSSIWSAINCKKVEELTKKGLMEPAGIAAFNQRKESKSRIYSYEQKEVSFSEIFLKKFKANKKAWDYFQSKPNWYRKTSTHWVMSAKQETTSLRRLDQLIACCEEQKNIRSLDY